VNSIHFLSQIVFIFLFTYGAFRMGKPALITAVTTQAILANLFVLKQISLFGFHITCSDAFAVGSIFGLNILREYWGRDAVKEAIKVCFLFMAFFVVMAQFHLRFIPSPFDTAHFAYARLLTPSPRLLIASLGTFWIVQQFDLRAFGWISKIMPHSPFPYRSTLSLTLSQLLDTILFSFLGLYGMVAHIGHIILISFLVKAGIILLMGPLMTLLNRTGRHV